MTVTLGSTVDVVLPVSGAKKGVGNTGHKRKSNRRHYRHNAVVPKEGGVTFRHRRVSMPNNRPIVCSGLSSSSLSTTVITTNKETHTQVLHNILMTTTRCISEYFPAK